MVHKRRGQVGLEGIVRLVALSAIAALSGCSDEACFSWSQAEGACPAQEDALQFFVPVGCTGSVQSVDSEGELVIDNEDPFPGDLCCYSVTQDDNEFGFCNGGPPF